jgi:hypothetical protein
MRFSKSQDLPIKEKRGVSMDDKIIHSLQRLFYKKIMLYHDLLHCLNQERDSLINIDLDRLWSISREKEEVCTKIKSLRQEVISTLVDEGPDQHSFDLNRIMDIIPRENRGRFQELYRTLIRLESEVEVLRKENMLFINDSLQFLDEMIAILTGQTPSEFLYNDRCHLSKSSSNALFLREV